MGFVLIGMFIGAVAATGALAAGAGFGLAVLVYALVGCLGTGLGLCWAFARPAAAAPQQHQARPLGIRALIPAQAD